MDGIQPHAGALRAVVTPPAPHAHPHAAHGSPSAKAPADYLRALRRRPWLALAVALPIIMGGSWLVLRMPNVYRATAEILIEPPMGDVNAGVLLPNYVPSRDNEAMAKYVPNHLAQLKLKSLADKVVADPDIVQEAGNDEELAAELMTKISYRVVLGSSNVYQIILEGRDAPLTAKRLHSYLRNFRDGAISEISGKGDATVQVLNQSLKVHEDKLKEMDAKIARALAKSSSIGPGGRSLHEERYLQLERMVANSLTDLHHVARESAVLQLNPKDLTLRSSPLDDELRTLGTQRRKLISRLNRERHSVRDFDRDPSVIHFSEQLADVMAQEREIQSRMKPSELPVDVSSVLLEQARANLKNYEDQLKVALEQMQTSMPEAQAFQNQLEERRKTFEAYTATEARLASFKLYSTSIKTPVLIPDSVAEPVLPASPNRPLLLAGLVFLGLAAGCGLVCGLEHVDHSVKVPEHLSHGLALPIFGVIPRMRRTSELQRGGHLWTPGSPASAEADAFRNLRASLLGLGTAEGPVVSLLVTSAKAGEGKSTTALNLAATCARSGERTLLVDVDLRRPSLSGVFADRGNDLGLVDVLAQDIPWARAVVRTDLPNLDFLPTGDTSRTPVEILGSLEMRQLLKSLSQNHYDRVILDGPAVLGLADCRMLGRMVDAAMLVVRSGSLELRPLQRAKAMLEQSSVPLAGVVFNGLSDDWSNWSSYGDTAPHGYPSAGELSGADAPAGRAALTAGAAG